MATRSAFAATVLFGAFAGCGRAVPAPAPVEVVDVDGAVHVPQRIDGDLTEVHVVVFVSPECPIANACAPTLRSLAAQWQGRGVRLFLAHVEPETTADAARAHAREYELTGTILLDPGQHLAAALGVTRTPEAVVLNRAGIAYRGRIDDQWRELGVRAQAPTAHDLRDAVEVALRGGAVPLPHPPAVGCLLPEPRH